VTLNRPQARNAINRTMFSELSRVLHDLDSDDEVRAIVMTGAGDHFCVGADISAGPQVFAPAPERSEALAPWRLLTPVLGALNGTAVGAGLTLALQWDIVIVADDAKLGLPFARRGLVPERNTPWIRPG
jgi:enoyl-CoA hydratase/carnithine racemase